MFFQHLEHQAADIGCARQRVLQKSPHLLGHAAVMRVHPESVLPGASGDMDFADAVEPQAVDGGIGIVTVVDGIAPDVVEVE